LLPSPFLRKPLLRPPNLRVDIKDVECKRLSGITLWFRNAVLNDAFIEICRILSIILKFHHWVKKRKVVLTLIFFLENLTRIFLRLHPPSFSGKLIFLLMITGGSK
jgi:hypothetical protein